MTALANLAQVHVQRRVAVGLGGADHCPKEARQAQRESGQEVSGLQMRTRHAQTVDVTANIAGKGEAIESEISNSGRY